MDGSGRSGLIKSMVKMPFMAFWPFLYPNVWAFLLNLIMSEAWLVIAFLNPSDGRGGSKSSFYHSKRGRHLLGVLLDL